MGACISCLRGYDEDGEQTIDENTSLLPDEQQRQQEEEMRMELRNKELNNILNSTNDHLIDVSNFKQQQHQYSTMTSSIASQPQDMTNSAITRVDSDGYAAEIFKVEPVDQPAANEAVRLDLDELARKVGSARLERLTSINTKDVGPLVVSLD